MTQSKALLAAGALTLTLLLGQGVVSRLLPGAVVASEAPVADETPPIIDEVIPPQAQVVEQTSNQDDAALFQSLWETHKQYSRRQEELTALIDQRQAEHEVRLGEAASQLSAYQSKTDAVTQTTLGIQQQVVQLEQQLAERQVFYDTQRRQFETEREAHLTPLQNQLTLAQAALAEARAELWQ
jgi:hypothetical protein